MGKSLPVLVVLGLVSACAPSDPRYQVRYDATLQCLWDRGLTSKWELDRAYTAAVGVSTPYMPNTVTSVGLAYASAHCTVNAAEREKLLTALRSGGYADPT